MNYQRHQIGSMTKWLILKIMGFFSASNHNLYKTAPQIRSKSTHKPEYTYVNCNGNATPHRWVGKTEDGHAKMPQTLPLEPNAWGNCNFALTSPKIHPEHIHITTGAEERVSYWSTTLHIHNFESQVRFRHAELNLVHQIHQLLTRKAGHDACQPLEAFCFLFI